MQIKVVGTGSLGNCYLLISNTGRVLLLDAGCNPRDVKKALNFNVKCIDGVFVTHEHKDHDRYSKDFEKMGLKVWRPFMNPDKNFEKSFLGVFEVLTFDLPHDGTVNRGALISCGTEKMLYATDFEYIPYTFKALMPNHLLIECNYIPSLVDEYAENKDHVIKGHASIDVSMEVVKANKSERLRNVVFCHLSSRNADSEQIIDRARKIVDCPVYVARNNMTIDLDCPFN